MAPKDEQDQTVGDPGADQRAIAGIEDDDQAPGVLAQAGPGHPTDTGEGRHIPPVDPKSAKAAPHGESGESGFKGDAEKGAAKS